MKYHLLNIVRGGLPVVGAVTGGLTVAKHRPGLAWVAGGSLAGWVGGYVTRNLVLNLFGPKVDKLPRQAIEPAPELKQQPQSVPQVPDLASTEAPPSPDEGDKVIDITPKKASRNDGFGTV